MGRIGGRAIVVGAGIGGLLAARALSDHYDAVTVVERDALDDTRLPRKGVPQGRHVHGLLARGSQTLDRLFPGFTGDVLAEGATPGDIGDACLWYNFGSVLARAPSGIRGYFVSRPTLEYALRRRLAGLDNVLFKPSTEAVEPVFDQGRGRVTGLRVRATGADSDGETLPADLVVDCGGRGARTPAWLERLGYPKPDVETVRIDLAYTTRSFRRKPGQLMGLGGAVIGGGAPEWRGGGVNAQEGDRWLVTLGEFFGARGPDDLAGFVAYARSLQRPEIYDLVRDSEPLSDPAFYMFSESVRPRYERLERFPEGLLVFGDGLCSFNPFYGQGMTVAALEALALLDCLAKGEENLARRFFATATKVIDMPWRMALGTDLLHPRVEGARPLSMRLLNWYAAALFRAGARDALVARRFLEVAQLLRPPTALFTPAIVWRVLRGQSAPASSASEVSPSEIPG
jgi:2-polyprenyl-6-methoxyphenol hydroxylase-like FAD-dependent oxidoreductase